MFTQGPGAGRTPHKSRRRSNTARPAGREREKVWLEAFRALTYPRRLRYRLHPESPGSAMFNTLAMIVMEKTKGKLRSYVPWLYAAGHLPHFLWQAAIVLMLAPWRDGRSERCTYAISYIPSHPGILSADTFIVIGRSGITWPPAHLGSPWSWRRA